MTDEATVNVVDPLGKVGSLSQNDANEAVNNGYRLANPDEVHSAKNEQRFGGVTGAVFAGTLGAARTATLGASDILATSIPGGFTPEQIQGLKDTNPVSTTIGELGGILQDPLAIGKVIGGAGKAVSSGAKAVLTTAKTAEDMSLATKTLINTLGFGTEGAIYGGITNSANDYALGDPSINGEKVLANVGWGALVGGGAGSAFKLLGYGITPALRKATDSLAEVRNELFGSGFGEEALVHKVLPKRFADAISDRQLNLDTQGQASTIKNVVSHLNNATESIQKEISDFESDMSKNKEAISSVFPRDYLDSEIGQKSLQNHLAEAEQMKHQAAMDFVEKNPDMSEDVSGSGGFWKSDHGKKLLEMQSKAIDEIRNAPGAASQVQQKIAEGLGGIVDQIKNVIPDGATKDALESLRNKANFGKFVGNSSEAIFNHLKNLKGKINDFISDEPALKGAFDPVTDSIDASMKDPKTFGAAGAAQAIHDDNVTTLRKFVSDTGKQTEFQKTFGEMKNGKWQFDPNKMHAVLADTNEVSRTANFNQLNDFFSHLNEMPDQILSARKAIPNSTWRKQTISQVISNAKKSTDDAFQDYLSGIQKRRPIYGWKDLAPVLIAKWHPVLAAAIEAYDFYQDPVHAMHELALIERIVGKTTKKSIDLIDSIFSPQLGAEKAIQSKGTVPDVDSDKEDGHKKFKRIANDPEIVSQNIDKSVKGINDSAPNISQHLSVLGNQATSFLASKMPQGNDHLNPFSDSYEPSRQEITKFENYKNVVENPLISLEQVRNKTISPETIETLNMVYPKLYQELKQNMLQKAFEHKQKGKAISFQTRQAISAFLGEPVEQSLSPQSILANQMILSSAPKPGQMAQGKARAKGLDDMDRSGRFSADYGAMDDKV